MTTLNILMKPGKILAKHVAGSWIEQVPTGQLVLFTPGEKGDLGITITQADAARLITAWTATGKLERS